MIKMSPKKRERIFHPEYFTRASIMQATKLSAANRIDSPSCYSCFLLFRSILLIIQNENRHFVVKNELFFKNKFNKIKIIIKFSTLNLLISWRLKNTF